MVRVVCGLTRLLTLGLCLAMSPHWWLMAGRVRSLEVTDTARELDCTTGIYEVILIYFKRYCYLFNIINYNKL